MKILLLGKNGQVGWELNRSLQPLGQVVALGRDEADFSMPDSLRAVIRRMAPDIIVNAVAYTAVDKAEEEEELANTINHISVAVLAEEALKINALLVHYSTDYVFDGTKDSPYLETDKPNPINAYGRTKLAGEQAVQKSGCDYLIFRTSWVYSSRGNNFLLTMLRLAKERDSISVVNDQIGAPTPAWLIADMTFTFLSRAILARNDNRFTSGIYHLTSAGYTSWHGFAEEIMSLLKQAGREVTVTRVEAISSSQYVAAARRPKNSRLCLDKLQSYIQKMPSWLVVLEAEIKKND